MKSLLKRIYSSNRELILYGIIGAISSGSDFLIYSLLVMGGISVIVSNVIGVNCGILLSFFFNRKFNFKVTDKTYRRFALFYTVGIVGLVISTSLLYLFVDIWGYNEFYSKIATIIIVAVIQFVLNKTVTFRVSSKFQIEE